MNKKSNCCIIAKMMCNVIFYLLNVFKKQSIYMKNKKKKAGVIWFTGLSGAGKTTLATQLASWFKKQNIDHEFLDGEVFRYYLYLGLDYSREDRKKKAIKIGYVTHLLNKHNIWVIVASITAYRQDRAYIRKMINGKFIEIYVNCPLNVVKKRDTKGFYKKVAMGLEKNFSGIDSPYEPPIYPEIEVNTNKQTIAESFKIIKDYISTKL